MNLGSVAEQAQEAQSWNWHAQNTDIVQYHPGFPAAYSGPNSLDNAAEVRETVSLDLLAGVRLWSGGEAHVDGLLWQGFGLGKTLGVESFPNGEAFRLGTKVPNVNFSRVFFRQTVNLGGENVDVPDTPLQLAGREDSSRLVFTIGRFSAKDIFDNNSYANDPRAQFMSWGLMANEAWDYPADSLGYTTGGAIELIQPEWAIRYGFFQMPRSSNGTAQDSHYLQAWGMVLEFEKPFHLLSRPGTARLLVYLNSAHMGSYEEAVDSPVRPADIEATRDYRLKSGVGLNLEQEVVTNVGAFMRLGWSDGNDEAWVFSDVDRSASLGFSLKGSLWNRANDTLGIAGVLSGASEIHQRFLAAGGLGILAGDGALTYGWEKNLEVYYDFQIWKTLHGTLDYQFIVDPAFNQDRGPVSVFGARLHWEL